MKELNDSYKIGQIIEILKREYPDISASSLRFWEKEGLIIPSVSGKSKGVHRLYTNEDLEIIRYIKELSQEGKSINEIKTNLGSWIKNGKHLEVLRMQTNVLKRMRKMAGYLKEVLKEERPKNFYDYIYPEDTLVKLLNSNNAKSIMKKAEEYKLILPKLIGNSRTYNQMDFTIMKLITDSEIDSLEKYNKLYEMIEYMERGLKLPMSFILSAMTALSELLQVVKKIKLEEKDLFVTSALLYLETIYFEEFRSK